jgi:hypothetical protein
MQNIVIEQPTIAVKPTRWITINIQVLTLKLEEKILVLWMKLLKPNFCGCEFKIQQNQR